jgi:hypothetical protein
LRTQTRPEDRLAVYERLRQAGGAVPGVTRASASLVSPVGGITSASRFQVSEGAELPDRERLANFNAITHGANPVGHTLQHVTFASVPPREIVGLVADAVYRNIGEPVPPTIYVPLAQFDTRPQSPMPPVVTIALRTATRSPAFLVRGVSAAILAVNPDLSLAFRTLSNQVASSLAQERLVAMLPGFFGVLALLLAGLGLYGVTSYAVTRRRTEIGIRMAPGAASTGVIRLVMSRVWALIGVGIVIGAGISLWASKFVASLLYGLEPRDPATLVGSAVVLAAVGGLAGWLPAWRASRIDPAGCCGKVREGRRRHIRETSRVDPI